MYCFEYEDYMLHRPRHELRASQDVSPSADVAAVATVTRLQLHTAPSYAQALLTLFHALHTLG